MADEDFTFTEGIDPTSVFAAGQASVLLQLIREAVPNPYRGMLIYGATTPATSGDYAWQKRCVWVKTDDWTFYYFNDDLGSWESLFAAIPDDTITTAMLGDGIVTLTKLAVGAGVAGQIVRINAGATGFEFVAPADAIPAGALAVTKLAAGANDTVLMTVSGTVGWQSFASKLASTLTASPILTPAMFTPPGASTYGKYLRTAPDNTLEWTAFDLNTAQATGSVNVDMLAPGDNGQFLLTIGGNVTWGNASNLAALSIPVSKLEAGADGEVLTVVSGAPTWSASNGLTEASATALSAGIKRILAHNLAAIPKRVRWVLRCIDASGDGGFAFEDEIDVAGVYEGSGGGQAFLSWADDTNCYLVRMSSGTYTTLNPSTGAFANVLDVSKWASVCYYGA